MAVAIPRRGVDPTLVHRARLVDPTELLKPELDASPLFLTGAALTAMVRSVPEVRLVDSGQAPYGEPAARLTW